VVVEATCLLIFWKTSDLDK